MKGGVVEERGLFHHTMCPPSSWARQVVGGPYLPGMGRSSKRSNGYKPREQLAPVRAGRNVTTNPRSHLSSWRWEGPPRSFSG